MRRIQTYMKNYLSNIIKIQIRNTLRKSIRTLIRGRLHLSYENQVNYVGYYARVTRFVRVRERYALSKEWTIKRWNAYGTTSTRTSPISIRLDYFRWIPISYVRSCTVKPIIYYQEQNKLFPEWSNLVTTSSRIFSLQELSRKYFTSIPSSD